MLLCPPLLVLFRKHWTYSVVGTKLYLLISDINWVVEFCILIESKWKWLCNHYEIQIQKVWLPNREPRFQYLNASMREQHRAPSDLQPHYGNVIFGNVYLFALDDTRRLTMPVPHCRSGSCRSLEAQPEPSSEGL